VPLILKEFFEEDILEEEVILDWAKKVWNHLRWDNWTQGCGSAV